MYIFLWGYGRLSIVEDKVGLGELRSMLDVGEALEEWGCGAGGRIFILFSQALDLFSRSTVGIFPTIMTLCQTQWGGSGSVGTNDGKNSHRPRSLHCVWHRVIMVGKIPTVDLENRSSASEKSINSLPLAPHPSVFKSLSNIQHPPFQPLYQPVPTCTRASSCVLAASIVTTLSFTCVWKSTPCIRFCSQIFCCQLKSEWCCISVAHSVTKCATPHCKLQRTVHNVLVCCFEACQRTDWSVTVCASNCSHLYHVLPTLLNFHISLNSAKYTAKALPSPLHNALCFAHCTGLCCTLSGVHSMVYQRKVYTVQCAQYTGEKCTTL